MKNLSQLRVGIKSMASVWISKSLLPSALIRVPLAPFARKKGNSVIEDLMSKDSKSIDQSNLAEDVTRSEVYNDKTVREEESHQQKDAKDTIMSAIEQNKPVTAERITTKILCELIGSKHYPSNEEIQIAAESVVTVYDENDKLLGNMFLYQVLENAGGLDKDVVLRNDKVKPPIVKMMKYRVELVKRLFKKLGKSLGKDLGDKQAAKHKVYGFSLKMDKNDFDSKVDKLRALLAENNYVKVVIPVDLESNDQVLRANQILKNIASEIPQLAKIRAGPIKQKKRKENIRNLDPNAATPVDELNYHNKVIKDAYETASLTSVESEKDLDYIDSVYIEFESLIVDNSGIDYEKLLKTSNLDTIVRGMTHTNVIGEINSASMESKGAISREAIEDRLAKGIASFSSAGSETSLKQQLKMLEKEAVVQQDYSKKVRIQEKIDNMKDDLIYTQFKFNARLLKFKMMDLTKRSAKKEGLLDRNKA